MKRKNILMGTIAAAVVAIAVVLVLHPWRPRSVKIQGAVIRRDEDTRKESPIADAEITVTNGATSARAQSDDQGYFVLRFPREVWPGRPLRAQIRHAGYEPFTMELGNGPRAASRELHVAAMTPEAVPAQRNAGSKPVQVTNIRVRYTVNSQSEENIGSAVKTFQVVNKREVACDDHGPCSPDGRWKASSASVQLDAGPDHEFRNARAFCIAGPCPFTRIDPSGYANGGRTISASAIAWSDTSTFLLEAEVFRTEMSSRVRELYPVVFGQALHFTLPPTQEGVSLEADLDGVPMVFPLGAELNLSWAACTVRSDGDAEKATVYQCELKPGYTF